MARSQSSDSIPLPNAKFGPLATGQQRAVDGVARASRPSGPLVPGVVPYTAPADLTHEDLTGETHPAIEQGAEGRGFVSVLRNKYFLRLWMAQLISQTVMNATNFGLLTLITTEHKSLLATGGAIVAFSLPALLFGAPAGVVVDRFDRRTVLWMSNALRALATGIFVISLMIDPAALIPAYLLTFFIAVIGQFFTPAEGAAIPRLVHPKELINALALFNITFTMSQAAGLIIFGPLVLLLVPTIPIDVAHQHIDVQPVQTLLVLIALLYIVCMLLVLSIPRERLRALGPEGSGPRLARQGKQIKGVLQSIIECANYIRRDQRLSVVVWQLSLAGVVTSVIAMIAPQFVTEFFHLKPAAAALVFVPAGFGLIVGSAFTPRITRRFGHGRTVGAGIIALAACTLAIPLVRFVVSNLYKGDWARWWPYLVIVLVLTLLMGIALDFINVPAQAMMQALSPDWIKGRVLAVQIMLFNAVTIPVVLMLGYIGDRFSLSRAMVVLAGFVLLTGLSSIASWRHARKHVQANTDDWHDLDHPDHVLPLPFD